MTKKFLWVILGLLLFNVGCADSKQILQNVKSCQKNQYSLHCALDGYDLDFSGQNITGLETEMIFRLMENQVKKERFFVPITDLKHFPLL